MKRILVLSRFSRMGASTRLRTMQYAPYLAQAGFAVDVHSFFDDAYLETIYSGRAVTGGVLRYYLGRVRRLLQASAADAIWLEKEALPWVPWLLERQLYPRAIPVVSDYDDAWFHRYDAHSNALVRRGLGRKIDGVMANSTVVFAGNNYLAARARRAGAKRIEVVPTVVDMMAYGVGAARGEHDRLRVGWIGTPRTWPDYVVPMLPMLKAAMVENKAMFHAIGAPAPSQPDAHFQYLPWSEASEIRLIQGLDVGIMPLHEAPLAQGKCGYKLIQYMACGLPVIASPVGVNAEIVEHGVNGFLASTPEEWRNTLSLLLQNKDLRRRFGAAGRKKVEALYSIQSYGPKVACLFETLISEPGQQPAATAVAARRKGATARAAAEY